MTMNTPRPRSQPPPPHPPLFKPTTPPPPPLLSTSTSPPHDFSFAHYLSSPPPSVQRRGRADMSRSHNNYSSKANQHRQTGSSSSSSSSKEKDREYKAKSKASSPFFSGLGGSWRSGLSRDEEVKRKAKAKTRGLDVGQWVKKYMASMVEHLLASFSRHGGGEREKREQQRRRPHSFSAHGPSALREARAALLGAGVAARVAGEQRPPLRGRVGEGLDVVGGEHHGGAAERHRGRHRALQELHHRGQVNRSIEASV
uniref:Uncharacterized protein n=1 Tax=Oryza barthii TaxID=65489 RepID=A0A0D3H7R0_9ORYZ